MKPLNLRVRYFQDSTPADVPCRETAFIRREFDMPLPIEETALVLVDLWNVHFIESWIERAAQVTTECVVPVLDAARGSRFDNRSCAFSVSGGAISATRTAQAA